MNTRIASLAIAVTITIGLLLIGWVDYATGTEVRVFPLYFLPLVAAAHRFGRTGAFVGSLLATCIWELSEYTSKPPSGMHVYVFNFITQGTGFLVVSWLVASLHAGRERERQLSRTDPLTGLANRRAFEELAGQALALCERNRHPVCVAYLDLDNFKQANDRFGHAVGDAILKRVGQILQSNLRASDIMARLGGDEFVIMLPETTSADALTVLEKLRSLIEREPDLNRSKVTASIGAISYARPILALGRILDAADRFMYNVKYSSGNRVSLHEVHETF